MNNIKTVRLTAPFRCHFNLHNPKVASYPKEFNKFLIDLKSATKVQNKGLLENLPFGINIKVNTKGGEDDSNAKFIDVDQSAANFSSPEILRISLKNIDSDEIWDIFKESFKHASDKCSDDIFESFFVPDINSPVIYIYDNTIGMMMMDIDIRCASDDQIWKYFDKFSTLFAEKMLEKFYPKYIWPVLNRIVKLSKDNAISFVLEPEKYYVFLDMMVSNDSDNNSVHKGECSILWVSRTLVINDVEYTNKWIENSLCPESEIIKTGTSESHLGWGNNLIYISDDKIDSEYTEDIWEGTRISQYYYAAADVVNSNLSSFIGMTYSQHNNKDIKNVSHNMEAVVSSVTILQVKHLDAYIELQGTCKTVFQRFEEQWKTNDILDNVQTKIDLCKGNVEQLYREKNQRNQSRTELVLTSLAGLGIVNLMLVISNYAKTIEKDGLEVKNEHIPGIIDLGQYLSANTMGWIGIILAIICAFIVVLNRPR